MTSPYRTIQKFTVSRPWAVADRQGGRHFSTAPDAAAWMHLSARQGTATRVKTV